MGFLRKKQDSPAAVPNIPPSASDATTPTQSKAASIVAEEDEKRKPTYAAVEQDKVQPGAQVTVDSADSRANARDQDGDNALEKRIEETEADEEQQEAEGDEDIEYPQAMKLALITIALCLSVFCMALDNTIISTAIPKITDQFHSIDDVGWYGSAYLLTTCAFQLFFGKLYTFLSIKYVYLTAIVIFEIGGAVCGAAPNSPALIVGRAIAGLGSAGIFSGAVLIVSNTVPLKTRPTYMGVIGGMYGIASVAGPLMGGAFTDKVTWRWCFYINLPIGAVTIAFIAFFYHPTKRAQKMASTFRMKLEQFDLYGTAIFLPMIICLLLALQWGGSKYSWRDGRIIALFVVFAVLLVSFVSIQFWKQDNGTVPPRVLRQRTVASAAWFAVTVGAAFFILFITCPSGKPTPSSYCISQPTGFVLVDVGQAMLRRTLVDLCRQTDWPKSAINWFQAIKGVSAVGSGIRNIPMILSLVIFSMIGGVAVTKLGYYTPFILTSSVLMSIGAGLLSTFKVHSGSGMWIGYQIIFGAGVGFGMQNTLVAVQAVLPAKDIPIGTSIIMFCQTLGGALFISVAQNVFTNRLLANVKSVVPGIDPELVVSAGATSLQSVIPKQFYSGVQVAYNEAVTSTFYVAVAMAALSIFGAACLEWKSIKGKKVEMTAA